MKTVTPRRAFDVSPWRELEALEGRMRRLMGRPDAEIETTLDWVPDIDLTESEDALTLMADLPGMKADDVELLIENGVLTVRGVRDEEVKRDEGKWHVWERRTGSFERCVTLPPSIDEGGVQARFADGVLTVTLPKKAEVKGTRIPIRG